MSSISKRNTLLADLSHFFQPPPHNFIQSLSRCRTRPVSSNDLELVNSYAYELIPTRARFRLVSVIGLFMESTTQMIILMYSNVLE